MEIYNPFDFYMKVLFSSHSSLIYMMMFMIVKLILYSNKQKKYEKPHVN